MVTAAAAAQSGLAYALGRSLLGCPPRARTPEPIDLAGVRRVVVLRPDEIGDVVLTTAFLRELRLVLPSAHITLVVKPEVRDLVELCPYVNAVKTYDVSGPKWARPFALPLRALRMASAERRAGAPDLVLLPRWDADQSYATFLGFWTGARYRVGHAERVTGYKHTINRGFDRLLTHALDDRRVLHEVEQTMGIIRLLGREPADDRLELWTGPADDAFAARFLGEHGVAAGDAVVALSPGAGHSRLKQWPVQHFRELAGTLLDDGVATRVLVVGSKQDGELARRIADGLGGRVIDAAGKATLRQTAALLRRCRLFVGNDTGPMHMAAAVGVPVVALFGPSDHRRYSPWRRQTVVTLDLACSPAARQVTEDRCPTCIFAHPLCMDDMRVPLVADAVRSAAGRAAGGALPG